MEESLIATRRDRSPIPPSESRWAVASRESLAQIAADAALAIDNISLGRSACLPHLVRAGSILIDALGAGGSYDVTAIAAIYDTLASICQARQIETIDDVRAATKPIIENITALGAAGSATLSFGGLRTFFVTLARCAMAYELEHRRRRPVMSDILDHRSPTDVLFMAQKSFAAQAS